MVSYSHLLKNFPQFIVIHTVKGFGIVNKAVINVLLELSCFFHDPVDVGNLVSGSSAFSKTSFTLCLWIEATSLSLFTFHFHALEKEIATHSRVLAWRIPGTEEPGGLPSMGSHRVGCDLAAAAASDVHRGWTVR